MDNELRFGNDMPKFEFGSAYNKASNNYNEATNKPSINGVVLEGNKTTEELGIEAGSNINVLTELDMENTHEDNDVYSANVTNEIAQGLVELSTNIEETVGDFDEVIQSLAVEISKVEEATKDVFDVSCTISLATMTVSNISAYSATIIEEKNKGKIVRMNCSFAENSTLKASVLLNVVEGNVASFYPVIVGDLGAGKKNYLFWLQIRASGGNITATALAEEETLNETLEHINTWSKAVEEILVGFNTRIETLETVATELEEI